MVILAVVGFPTAGAVIVTVDPVATPTARLACVKLAWMRVGNWASTPAGSRPAVRITRARVFIGLLPSARTTPWEYRAYRAARGAHPAVPADSPRTDPIPTVTEPRESR